MLFPTPMQYNVEPFTLLMSFPTSFYAGYVFADMRFRSFDKPINQLLSPFIVRTESSEPSFAIEGDNFTMVWMHRRRIFCVCRRS